MIAKIYQDFDAYAVVTSQYIGQHWQRLRIDETQKAEMLIAFNHWTALWYQYIDPVRKTDRVTAQVAEKYTELDTRFRKMVQQVKHDYGIELTSEDITVLRIKGRTAGG